MKKRLYAVTVCTILIVGIMAALPIMAGAQTPLSLVYTDSMSEKDETNWVYAQNGINHEFQQDGWLKLNGTGIGQNGLRLKTDREENFKAVPPRHIYGDGVYEIKFKANPPSSATQASFGNIRIKTDQDNFNVVGKTVQLQFFYVDNEYRAQLLCGGPTSSNTGVQTVEGIDLTQEQTIRFVVDGTNVYAHIMQGSVTKSFSLENVYTDSGSVIIGTTVAVPGALNMQVKDLKIYQNTGNLFFFSDDLSMKNTTDWVYGVSDGVYEFQDGWMKLKGNSVPNGMRLNTNRTEPTSHVYGDAVYELKFKANPSSISAESPFATIRIKGNQDNFTTVGRTVQLQFYYVNNQYKARLLYPTGSEVGTGVVPIDGIDITEEQTIRLVAKGSNVTAYISQGEIERTLSINDGVPEGGTVIIHRTVAVTEPYDMQVKDFKIYSLAALKDIKVGGYSLFGFEPNQTNVTAYKNSDGSVPNITGVPADPTSTVSYDTSVTDEVKITVKNDFSASEYTVNFVDYEPVMLIGEPDLYVTKNGISQSVISADCDVTGKISVRNYDMQNDKPLLLFVVVKDEFGNLQKVGMVEKIISAKDGVVNASVSLTTSAQAATAQFFVWNQFLRPYCEKKLFVPGNVEPGSDEEQSGLRSYRVQETAALPHILLLGDSISIGYHFYTVDALEGKAYVHRPYSASDSTVATNCVDTGKSLELIANWLGSKQWDVIHFNWGLHDLKRVTPEMGTESNDPSVPPFTPIETYKENLQELVNIMKATGAKLIFATTTPFPSGVLPCRLPEDAIIYNDAAIEVMQANGVEINDLYALALPELNTIQQPANVHFKPVGSKLLGDAVADVIEGALADRDL
ncbi:MAG: SGNH/GDSL hydrolase family protein [Firmicutes bacterium]|nr:SGNH/GDSL hydrolase family protein [Bacillota bacterium]